MKFKIGSPLKTILVSQYFGQNGNKIYKEQGMTGHNGMDLITGHGTPVFAAHDGRAYYQIDSAGGHGVVLVTNQRYDYEGTDDAYYKTIYWHLVDPIKETKYKSPIQDFPFGKDVKKGDIIGYADNTGLSTGNHLHFALKPVAQTGESMNSFYNLEQRNGYNGAIDPLPYFEDGVMPKPTSPKPALTWKEKFLINLKLAGVEWKDGKYQYMESWKGKRY